MVDRTSGIPIGTAWAALVLTTACGSSVDPGEVGGGATSTTSASGQGGATSTATTSGTTSTGSSGDPCAGLACGAACQPSCPDGAPCIGDGECSADGVCVPGGGVVCEGCPASEPEPGNPCAPEGAACEYDAGVVVACRPRSTCVGGTWEYAAPNCVSDPPPDPDCPTPRQGAPSGACDVATAPELCLYGDTICGCTPCFGGGPCGVDAQWVCRPPPAAPCPPVAPPLGSPCSDEGIRCLYGDCGLANVSAGRRCDAAQGWQDDPVRCPL